MSFETIIFTLIIEINKESNSNQLRQTLMLNNYQTHG